MWVTATFFALLPAVIVVPIQFIDARDADMAREIESSGAAPRPVVEIRQKVDRWRTGFSVDEQAVTYRTDRGTASAELHGYDQSAVVREEEGWFVVHDGDRQYVYVTADGGDGFLAEDFRSALDGEFDDVHRVADIWIGGWALVGFGLLSLLSLGRTRQGSTSGVRAAAPPILYVLGAAAFVGLAYGLSFPLGA